MSAMCKLINKELPIHLDHYTYLRSIRIQNAEGGGGGGGGESVCKKVF